MAHANQKHSNQSPSNDQLKKALSLIAAELARGPLRSSSLSKIMRDTFGGSDASGVWSWRMAYDMMQAAAVQTILTDASGSDPLGDAKNLATRLLTETRRSEQQIRLQQFSTPLPYAALAVRAAAIRNGETVLEPSAGTGSLAGLLKRAGGILMLNEVDPFRRRLLDVVFNTQVSRHDAEHIDDLLTSTTDPSVIVMNPRPHCWRWAYHQPIDRAGLKDIFGKDVSRDLLARLRFKDLITSGPRSPRPGAPHTFVTTEAFLATFDLQSLRDLPELDLAVGNADEATQTVQA